MATELQTPEYSEPRLRQKLEPELRRLEGPATLGDIVTRTGLPAERTEPVLRSLLDEYQGRLSVDENGELVYSFPRGMQRRKTPSDLLKQIGAVLWRAFKISYKVGILVVLVAYFLIFLVIMIALLVAVLSKGGDSDFDFDFDLDGCGDGCGDGCFWFWVFSDRPSTYSSAPQSFSRRGPTPYRQKTKAGGGKVPPWMLAYEFVFGEDKLPPDPLEDERRLLAFVRDQRGRVTPADVAALTGGSLEEADARLLNLMVRHGGDVEVADGGTLIYTFDRLMVSAGQETGGRRWSWFWERHEPDEPLNRNTPTANWTLGLLNGFNLLWSSIILFGGAPVFGGIAGASALWLILGPVPWLFSLLFFVIPLIRKQVLNGQNAARRQRNLIRALAERIFVDHAGLGGREPTAEVMYPEDAQRLEGLKSVPTPAMYEELVSRWEAELEVDDEGTIGHRFERLRRELAEVAEARRATDPRQFRLGAIEYDSDADN